MHSQICQVCSGFGWLWTMRLGVARRLNPNRTVTVRTQMRCVACAGQGNLPTAPQTLTDGRRLPTV